MLTNLSDALPVAAAIFLAMFAAPANLLAFLPKFYFGGLTAWIGQDILKASPLRCVLTCPAKQLLEQF